MLDTLNNINQQNTKPVTNKADVAFLNDPTILVILQQKCLVDWKDKGIQLLQKGFLNIVEQNHAYNFKLWHAEDRARRDDKGFEFVYHAKREIDQCNQQRNNAMEAMDQWLYAYLQPELANLCEVHSETPGMMIDRLSILTLKIYHMDLQANRAGTDSTHQQTCYAKHGILMEQQIQLTTCLAHLFQSIINKTRTFRVYHQFKMYNDPTLNPELYG